MSHSLQVRRAVPRRGRPGHRLRALSPREEIVPRLVAHRQALPQGSHRLRCAPLGWRSAASPSDRRSPPITGNVWQPVRPEHTGISNPHSGAMKRERWGGHPGHDQGRRHSLPRVVAPQALFPLHGDPDSPPVATAPNHQVFNRPIMLLVRDLRPASFESPCGATSRREGLQRTSAVPSANRS